MTKNLDSADHVRALKLTIAASSAVKDFQMAKMLADTHVENWKAFVSEMKTKYGTLDDSAFNWDEGVVALPEVPVEKVE